MLYVVVVSLPSGWGGECSMVNKHISLSPGVFDSMVFCYVVSRHMDIWFILVIFTSFNEIQPKQVIHI